MSSENSPYLHVVGARPNFMKAAPVIRELSSRGLDQLVVHTGQHYDPAMSDIFFEQLGIGNPEINLGVGSGSHAVQTAQIMMALEPVLLERKPRCVLVYGDVNSTVAASLVAAKLGIQIAHVEAGLRSFDRSMPEELNRLLTDQLSDFLFTPSEDGNNNLLREGISPTKIHFVGNLMIDTLVRLLPIAERCTVERPPGDFILATLHRPSNVDDIYSLGELLAALDELGSRCKVLFPIHPRTAKKVKESGIVPREDRVLLVPPVGYIEFLKLQKEARLVITDSGGIQEETTFLGIPCITVRDNTERPITLTMGTNNLVGRSAQKMKEAAYNILDGSSVSREIPPLWDGNAASRIADILLNSNIRM